MGLEKEISLDYLIRYVCKMVSTGSGNVLDEAQHAMVESRVKKRIIDLNLIGHQEYYYYIQKNIEDESKHLISLLTTHHTFFFREFYHFEYILKNLQVIIKRARARGSRKLRIYSAACSKGHEAYSLAMLFHKMLPQFDPEMDFEIVGTDIDEQCVKFATNGVYNYSEIKKIPEQFLEGHFERGKGELDRFVRVKKVIKNKCTFYPANLFDINHVKGEFDIIFCRNVFIYFDPETINQVLEIFKKHLYKNAFFITGLCESLKPLGLDSLYHRGICIYSFDDETTEIEAKPKSVKGVERSRDISHLVSPIPKPINLMIVDDSKSIQKLLSKIFSKDPDFNVVCIAGDGVEAEEMLKIHKVDAMTLDIHMPNKTGVEYLRDNYKPGHPEVIMVSSASREDSEFSLKALEYGASDFVEKPALNNIAQRADEIKSKLKMAFLSKKKKIVKSIHHEFKVDLKIENPDEKLRVLTAAKSSLPDIEEMIGHFELGEPPCVILFEGNKSFLEMYRKQLSSKTKLLVSELSDKLDINNIYVGDFDEFFESHKDRVIEKKTSVCVFGAASSNVVNQISDLPNIHLLLEDIPELKSDLNDIASDVFPSTSFHYVSSRYLGES